MFLAEVDIQVPLKVIVYTDTVVFSPLYTWRRRDSEEDVITIQFLKIGYSPFASRPITLAQHKQDAHENQLRYSPCAPSASSSSAACPTALSRIYTWALLAFHTLNWCSKCLASTTKKTA